MSGFGRRTKKSTPEGCILEEVLEARELKRRRKVLDLYESGLLTKDELEAALRNPWFFRKAVLK